MRRTDFMLTKLAERVQVLEPRDCSCGTHFEPLEDGASETECFPCARKTREEAARARLAAQEQARREHWIDTLVEAGVPRKYAVVPVTLPLPTEVREWAGDPWCLTLLGKQGTGKTWAATRVYGELVCKGWTGVWADAAESVDAIRMEIATERDGTTLRTLQSADVLLLDDFMAERQDSEFARDKLSLVLRHRYNHARATIITSNAQTKEGVPSLEAIREPRLASRMAEGIVRVLGGPDRRIKGGAR